MGRAEGAIQPKERRIKNFKEVSLGYSKKLATDEAQRCPQCADPVCMKGCPLGIDIPAFIRFLREGHAAEAYAKIKEQNVFPSVCGRICTAPCEAACVLNEEKAPIGIRALERYAADFHKGKPSRPSVINSTSKKAAVIGSGPSGLTAAHGLVHQGHGVVIFEALDEPGGALRYGIPEFRLPKNILDQEISELKSSGVEIRTNVFIGPAYSLEEIFAEGFDAVLLCLGSGVPQFVEIPGTQFGGVFYAEEFLMRANFLKSTGLGNQRTGSKMAVIGQGTVGLDCARIAVRQGAEAAFLTSLTEEEIQTRLDELGFAKEEGVCLETLVSPLEILANEQGFTRGVRCQRLDYADPQETGQWQIMSVPDSEFIVEADTVILAMGHQPNAWISRFVPRLKLNDDGTIWIDGANGMTSVPRVFACGNVVTNSGPAVKAMASGKKAAEKIGEYLIPAS